jgi:hypothetical protein
MAQYVTAILNCPKAMMAVCSSYKIQVDPGSKYSVLKSSLSIEWQPVLLPVVLIKM